jgi:excisionase family DNA binding protein
MGVARSVGDSGEKNAAVGRIGLPKLPTQREVRMMPRTNHGRTGRSRLLDIDAVAIQLAVTPRHIRRLVAERRIPYLKVGRFIRFDPAEVDAWLDAARRPELQTTGRWRTSHEST